MKYHRLPPIKVQGPPYPIGCSLAGPKALGPHSRRTFYVRIIDFKRMTCLTDFSNLFQIWPDEKRTELKIPAPFRELHGRQERAFLSFEGYPNDPLYSQLSVCLSPFQNLMDCRLGLRLLIQRLRIETGIGLMNFDREGEELCCNPGRYRDIGKRDQVSPPHVSSR
jgi:hypothetical protein